MGESDWGKRRKWGWSFEGQPRVYVYHQGVFCLSCWLGEEQVSFTL